MSNNFNGNQRDNPPNPPKVTGWSPQMNQPNQDRTFPNTTGPIPEPTKEYLAIRDDYRNITDKESLILIGGSFFAIFAAYIDILLIYVFRQLLRSNIPRYLLIRHSAVFLIMIIICILAIVQLKRISQWNKATFKENPSLSRLNYEIIDQMTRIKSVVLITVALGLAFLVIFLYQTVSFNRYLQNANLPLQLANYASVFELYKLYRWIAFALILIYTIIDFYQLRKWRARIKTAAKLDNIIISEIPELQDLERQLKDN